MEITISIEGVLTVLRFCFYILGSIAFIMMIKLSLMVMHASQVASKRLQTFRQAAAFLSIFSRRKKS